MHIRWLFEETFALLRARRTANWTGDIAAKRLQNRCKTDSGEPVDSQVFHASQSIILTHGCFDTGTPAISILRSFKISVLLSFYAGCQIFRRATEILPTNSLQILGFRPLLMVKSACWWLILRCLARKKNSGRTEPPIRWPIGKFFNPRDILKAHDGTSYPFYLRFSHT